MTPKVFNIYCYSNHIPIEYNSCSQCNLLCILNITFMSWNPPFIPRSWLTVRPYLPFRKCELSSFFDEVLVKALSEWTRLCSTDPLLTVLTCDFSNSLRSLFPHHCYLLTILTSDKGTHHKATFNYIITYNSIIIHNRIWISQNREDRQKAGISPTTSSIRI